MQALSSHYEIYKRVFLHPLMASKHLLVVRAGGGDDDLLRRGVQKHITDNQLAFGRHVLERHRHHIGCAIGAGRQRVSCLSGSPLRRGKRRSAACGKAQRGQGQHKSVRFHICQGLKDFEFSQNYVKQPRVQVLFYAINVLFYDREPLRAAFSKKTGRNIATDVPPVRNSARQIR